MSLLETLGAGVGIRERLELVDERRVSDSVDLALTLVESQLARPVGTL